MLFFTHILAFKGAAVAGRCGLGFREEAKD